MAKTVSVLIGVFSFFIFNLNLHALNLGEMSADSFLGEPLDINIELNAVKSSELATLNVSLASQALFQQANIPYPLFADRLIISLGPLDNGKAQIRVQSKEPFNDPFVYLLFNIEWAGGKVLREYTALIDPPEYATEILAEASNSKVMLRSEATPLQNKLHGIVKSGDSLSAITELYRPGDVSFQQAWIAFYKLNPHAFLGENLNVLIKGAELRIPDHTQMTAITKNDALQEVIRLSKPVLPEGTLPTTEQPRELKPASKPTLVVGNPPERESLPLLDKIEDEPAVTESEDIATTEQVEPTVNTRPLPTNEIAELEQRIRQAMSASNNETEVIKDELIAARSENKVLVDRMARLEVQLGKMSRLLALQTQALRTINEEVTKDNDGDVADKTLNKLNEGTAELNRSLNDSPPLVINQAQAFNLAEEPDSDIKALTQASDTIQPPIDAGTTEEIESRSENKTSTETAIDPQAITHDTEMTDPDKTGQAPESTNTVPTGNQLTTEQAAVLNKETQAPKETPANISPNSATDNSIAEPQNKPKATMLETAVKTLSGISTELWQLIGGAAAAFLALLFLLARRKDTQAPPDQYNKQFDELIGVNQQADDLIVDSEAQQHSKKNERASDADKVFGGADDEIFPGNNNTDSSNLEIQAKSIAETEQQGTDQTIADSKKVKIDFADEVDHTSTSNVKEKAPNTADSDGDRYDAKTSLELARAYIELGEDDIAKDFLNDAIHAGNDEIIETAKALLKKLA